MSATFIYVSRRAQRVVFALIALTVVNIVAAQCTPEPTHAMAAVRIKVSH
ncbi:hypothetical protein [Asticcacaulis solisilvae]